MAYMNQERKAQLAPAIKAACKKYGIKASIAVRNHMTLCVNIKSGRLDLIGNHVRVVDQPDGWAAQKQSIEKWVADGIIPHLLFSGSPGVGKTTLAKILLNELNVNPLDVLEINASRERNTILLLTWTELKCNQVKNTIIERDKVLIRIQLLSELLVKEQLTTLAHYI